MPSSTSLGMEIIKKCASKNFVWDEDVVIIFWLNIVETETFKPNEIIVKVTKKRNVENNFIIFKSVELGTIDAILGVSHTVWPIGNNTTNIICIR